MSTESKTSSGISLFGAMFLVFLTLKLTGYIYWSWWWITAPLWGPFALAALILLVWLVGFVVVELLKANARKRDDRARLLGKDAP